MFRSILFLSLCSWCILPSIGCGDDDTPSRMCDSTTECNASEECIDRMCVARQDVGVVGDGGMDQTTRDTSSCAEEQLCRGGLLCCDGTEECVDGNFCHAICESGNRCGDDGAICCGADQTCLDGVVCTASCGAEQALCGADLDTCCSEGDICLADACTTPGRECGDDFDCRDSALYCEHTIGRCLPTPGGDLCEVPPEFEDVAIVEEWHWEGYLDDSGTLWHNVISTPLVGDVSGDGIPDVVTLAYTGTIYHDSIVVAIHGGTGETLWVIERSDGLGADYRGLALGNLDPTDDALEVVYHLDGGGIRVVDGDGVTELFRRTGPDDNASIELADLNGDGVPDIVFGCRAYDGRNPADPAMDLFDFGGCGDVHAIADLNGDGHPDVTSGGIAINGMDGTILWGSTGGPHGRIAIADIDGDGDPDIIRVRSGRVDVLNHEDGNVLMGPWAIPGGGTGGAPTVADFDGDGLPEISTAGRGQYVVYDPDCVVPALREGGTCPHMDDNIVAWSAVTQDISSSVTGSSVFDFQGDGVAEVIYNDECFLHIYDGQTGEELLSNPIPSSSRTGEEYPIVVDVDGDGNSEIVVASNKDQAVIRDGCPAAYAAAFGVAVGELPAAYAQGTSGITVYGDQFDRWVPTRPIWNQYSYHVTNVESNGTIPSPESNNWSEEGLNNYRQNVQGRGVYNAPNLQVELTATDACAFRQIRLSAVVTNVGSRGVAAGVPVEFTRTDTDPVETVASLATMRPLLPGGSERLTVTVDVPTDVALLFGVRVNGAAAMAALECNGDDNTANGMGMCPGLL